MRGLQAVGSRGLRRGVDSDGRIVASDETSQRSFWKRYHEEMRKESYV